MSKRERILATAVGVMVPIALLFMGFFWFLGQQKSNSQEIMRLSKEIKTEERRWSDAQRANRRRIYYRTLSMPNDPDVARSAYEDWLKNLVIDKLRLKYEGLTPREEVSGKFKKNEVYFQQRYTLRFKSTLGQLVQFLHEFNQLDLLHRIHSIGITPLTEGTVANKKNIRSGQLSITMDLDVLRLVDAKADREDFLTRTRKLERSFEDYSNKIVYRNIFGPTNNTPVLSIRERSVTEGTDVSFTITGSDADADDILTFSLLDNQIPDATLVKKGTKDRSATFKAPALPIGEYNLKLSIADDGYPPKSSTAEMKLVVTEKMNSKPSWKSSFTHEVPAGEDFRVVLTASDPDVKDNLTFELLSSEIEGAQIEVLETSVAEENGDESESDDKDENTRQIAFLGPGVDAGEYKFSLKVNDNNEKTAKDATRGFTLKVVAPAVSQSSVAKITSIISKGDSAAVWIYSRMTDEIFQLKVGDSFELDRKKWTVRSIDFETQEVDIESNGKLYKFKRGSFLNNPKTASPIANASSDTKIAKDN